MSGLSGGGDKCIKVLIKRYQSGFILLPHDNVRKNQGGINSIVQQGHPAKCLLHNPPLVYHVIDLLGTLVLIDIYHKFVPPGACFPVYRAVIVAFHILLYLFELRMMPHPADTFDEHFDTFIPASRQPGQMQALLENLYSQQTTFGETDFSSLCVHLNKRVNKRSLLVLYTNFSGIGSLNRQLAYLQQLNRQHRLLVIFFEDAALKEYVATPARDTEGYYRHVIAEKFVFEKRLIVSTLKQHGISSVLTTPENLSVDVINKYLEMKSRSQI